MVTLAPYYLRFIPNFILARSLNQLIGSTNTKKKKDQSKKVPKLEKGSLTMIQFDWMSDHHSAFDTMKTTFMTAPVFRYLYISKEFMLETDVSLKGLGAVLSQEDKSGKACIIAYTRRTLRPSE